MDANLKLLDAVLQLSVKSRGRGASGHSGQRRSRLPVVASVDARTWHFARHAAPRYPVQRLAVFGSAVRGDFVAGKSEIDFLVRIKRCSPAQNADIYAGRLKNEHA